MPFSKIAEAPQPEGRLPHPGQKISLDTPTPSERPLLFDDAALPHRPLLHHVSETPPVASPESLCPPTPDPWGPLPTQPLPAPPHHPAELPSPNLEDLLDLGPNFAASVLPPTNVSLPPTHIVKTAHNLRLPSFEALGIANPHPDRITGPLASAALPSLGAGPLSKPEDPLHALSPLLAHSRPFSRAGDSAPRSPEAARPRLERRISVVTPPAEPGTVNWGSFVNVWAAGVGSPPTTGSGASPDLDTIPTSASGPAARDPLSLADLSDALGMAAWIETIKGLITYNLPPVESDSMKILSHALPCPSLTGHLFGQIIARIHETTTTPTAWINVFHALPGRYTLFDLPKSPPSTPGPPVEGEEYFTSKIFDSAVPVADYQLDSKLLPPSPRPVVPPGSVNVSIVERYIPPTNVNEFGEMFKLNGSSLLYDRLIELSPRNGLLLFIYPTRNGAKAFMHDYLGPVLDPLLRSVTVVHELSSSLGRDLGDMAAVDHLVDYDTLRSLVEQFLTKLNMGPPSLTPGANGKTSYSLIHAAKEELILERKAWASDWWIKQEKQRVRDLVVKYFRKKVPSSELTSNSLIQEILDGVALRDYPCTGGGPRGVELGVFIIKKSSGTAES